MKRIPILALALLAILTGQARGPEMLQVTAVRCWSLSGATRVVIEVSGEFDYHSERAHNPERIFFDIFRSRPWIANRRIYSADVNDKLVSRVRVAETLPGVTRIVLDLSGTTDCTATQLSNPNRLVIELRKVEQAPLPVPQPPAPVQPPSVAQPVQVPPASISAVTKPAVIIAAKPALGAAPPSVLQVESGKAAKLNSGGASSLTRVLGLKIRRVVLDPGHGGHDQGTIGPTGLMEKDLVLDIALRLGKLIESRMGSEVIFTRSDDTFIPLEGRTALANDKKADLFLSIHANSSPYPRIAGVESYYLHFTNSKDALAVAARENASSDKSVFELRDLIQRITLQDKAEESKEFAGRIQASLFAFEARYNSGIKNRGVKKAPFVVLIGASMPSVLAEVGFLSNPREEALLKRPEHCQKLAEALYRGLSRYAQSLSHFQMAEARNLAAN
jgi:N-acetylmuramoyl-L-alanine amidase